MSNNVFANVQLQKIADTLSNGIPVNISGGGGDSSGGGGGMSYSLEEQKIGTWVDGSDLYQITIEMSGETSGSRTFDISALGASKIVNVDAILDFNDEYRSVMKAQYPPISAGWEFCIQPSSVTYGITLLLGSQLPSAGRKIYVTIQYIK